MKKIAKYVMANYGEGEKPIVEAQCDGPKINTVLRSRMGSMLGPQLIRALESAYVDVDFDGAPNKNFLDSWKTTLLGASTNWKLCAVYIRNEIMELEFVSERFLREWNEHYDQLEAKREVGPDCEKTDAKINAEIEKLPCYCACVSLAPKQPLFFGFNFEGTESVTYVEWSEDAPIVKTPQDAFLCVYSHDSDERTVVQKP